MTSWDCTECNYPNTGSCKSCLVRVLTSVTDGLICAHCEADHPNPEELQENRTLGAFLGSTDDSEKPDEADEVNEVRPEPAVVGAADQAWQELLARGPADGEALNNSEPVFDSSDDDQAAGKPTQGDDSEGDLGEASCGKNALFDEQDALHEDEEVVCSSSNALFSM